MFHVHPSQTNLKRKYGVSSGRVPPGRPAVRRHGSQVITGAVMLQPDGGEAERVNEKEIVLLESYILKL